MQPRALNGRDSHVSCALQQARIGNAQAWVEATVACDGLVPDDLSAMQNGRVVERGAVDLIGVQIQGIAGALDL